MQRHSFNFETSYNHPNVVVYLSKATMHMAAWFSEYLENSIKNGTVFRAGETIQIGWMVLMLKGDDAGNLEVWEPSLDGMPIGWTQGASNTLRFLSIQKEVCSRIGTAPDYPSLAQSGLMSLDFLGSRNGFDMVREQPSGMDSGWVFQRHDVEVLEGKHCSLFEIGVSRPLVIPFLALPPEALVRSSKKEVEVEFGSKTVSSKTDHFLNKLRTSPTFG